MVRACGRPAMSRGARGAGHTPEGRPFLAAYPGSDG